MNHRWTKEEDIDLVQTVALYGTDWHKIEENFKSNRSRNALIKRWHTKLKSPIQNLSDREILCHSSEERKILTSNNPLSQSPDEEGHNETEQAMTWNEIDPKILRNLILQFHIYDWDLIAEQLSAPVCVVKKCWENKIYPQIKSKRKIAGALMWAPQEDDIILHAIAKENYKWENLLEFLPGRSYFSLQARWKRIYMRISQEKNCQEFTSPKPPCHSSTREKILEQYRRILNLRKSVKDRLHNDPSSIYRGFE